MKYASKHKDTNLHKKKFTILNLPSCLLSILLSTYTLTIIYINIKRIKPMKLILYIID